MKARSISVRKAPARISNPHLRSVYLKKYGARFLAIDPGTREMGIAVLENDGSLVHSQVLNLKGHRPKPALIRATQQALDRLVDFFMIDRIVMEKIPNPPAAHLPIARSSSHGRAALGPATLIAAG